MTPWHVTIAGIPALATDPTNGTLAYNGSNTPSERGLLPLSPGTKNEPLADQECGAASRSRRKMESSDSRGHVTEDAEQPRRVLMMGL